MKLMIATFLLATWYTGFVVSFLVNKHRGEKLVQLTVEKPGKYERVLNFLKIQRLDVWSDMQCFHTIEVIVPCHKLFLVKQFACRHRILFRVKYYDISFEIQQSFLENQRIESEVEKHKDDGVFSMNYEKYNEYHVIKKEVQRLKTLYPTFVRVCPVGLSFEKRLLFIVKVSENVEPCGMDTKPIIWIDSGMHGREWISTATGMFMLKELLFSTNDTVQELMQKNTFYFVPVFNPDGYAYTFTSDRLWRGTRTVNEGSTCVGADPNRNWNVNYGGVGSSSDPCNAEYKGIKPESEPCVHAFAEELRKKKDLIKAYFSLHSFNQFLLTPNSYTRGKPEDFKEIFRISSIFVNAIGQRYGTNYLPGSAAFLISPLSGLSMDYVHDELKVTNSYIIELRDRGDHMFLLPPDQIRPSGLETFDALIAVVKAL